MMAEFIKQIDIENFKSIRKVRIDNLHRINLFIGKPNVGKSNIIEALSLFSIPYLRENTSKKITNIIRIETEAELFYNGSVKNDAIVSTNVGKCTLGYNPKEGLLINVDFFGNSFLYRVDEKLTVKGGLRNDFFDPPIKKYVFKSNVKYRHSHSKYLVPPFGFNLLNIIENYDKLKSQVLKLFREYNLEIAFDKGSQTLKIIQSNVDNQIFLIPYNSIADTLQRIIFFKAAIESNSNSILLFEEPEAHSFPPYMTHLTQEMIYKNDNQYLIATHSPFILNDLLENCRQDLGVFVVSYENHETKLRKLSDSELHEIYQNGVDLFTNNESYA